MTRFFGMITAAILLAGLTAGAAQAQKRTINQRQSNQKSRIKQGVRSGELTRKEAAHVRAQSATLAAKEAKYRASGGKLTQAERRKLDRKQDRLSRRIHKQKHDRQDR
jgi:cytochrome c556